MDFLGWGAAFFTLAGTGLLAWNRTPPQWGWQWRVAGDVLWIVWGVIHGAWPIIASEAVFLTVDAVGWWRNRW